MPLIRDTKKSIYYEYYPDEMPEFWNGPGQGHDEAVKGTADCVKVKCTLEEAQRLSAAWVTDIFPVPTCTYYDGETLTFYCGNAAIVGTLVDSTVKYVRSVLGRNVRVLTVR